MMKLSPLIQFASVRGAVHTAGLKFRRKRQAAPFSNLLFLQTASKRVEAESTLMLVLHHFTRRIVLIPR